MTWIFIAITCESNSLLFPAPIFAACSARISLPHICLIRVFVVPRPRLCIARKRILDAVPIFVSEIYFFIAAYKQPQQPIFICGIKKLPRQRESFFVMQSVLGTLLDCIEKIFNWQQFILILIIL